MKFKIRLTEESRGFEGKLSPWNRIKMILSLGELYSRALDDYLSKNIESQISSDISNDKDYEEVAKLWNKMNQNKNVKKKLQSIQNDIKEYRDLFHKNKQFKKFLKDDKLIQKLSTRLEPVLQEFGLSLLPKSVSSDKEYGSFGGKLSPEDYLFKSKAKSGLDKDLESGWGDSDIDFESEDWSDFDDNEDIEIEAPSSWDVDDEDIEFGEPERNSKDKLEQDKKNQELRKMARELSTFKDTIDDKIRIKQKKQTNPQALTKDTIDDKLEQDKKNQELRKMARELSTFKDTVRDKIRIKQKKQTNPQALTKDTIDDKKEKARQQSNADRIIKRTRKEY